MKGATKFVPLANPIASYFNPRTREGCDTQRFRHDLQSFYISIHAPVKGATLFCQYFYCYWDYFNPRTREGCDDNITGKKIKTEIISIHAPVKGATFRRID